MTVHVLHVKSATYLVLTCSKAVKQKHSTIVQTSYAGGPEYKQHTSGNVSIQLNMTETTFQNVQRSCTSHFDIDTTTKI